MTDLSTLRHADPGSGELFDAIERLMDEGMVEEVDAILADREREIEGRNVKGRGCRAWTGAKHNEPMEMR